MDVACLFMDVVIPWKDECRMVYIPIAKGLILKYLKIDPALSKLMMCLVNSGKGTCVDGLILTQLIDLCYISALYMYTVQRLTKTRSHWVVLSQIERNQSVECIFLSVYIVCYFSILYVSWSYDWLAQDVYIYFLAQRTLVYQCIVLASRYTSWALKPLITSKVPLRVILEHTHLVVTTHNVRSNLFHVSFFINVFLIINMVDPGVYLCLGKNQYFSGSISTFI